MSQNTDMLKLISDEKAKEQAKSEEGWKEAYKEAKNLIPEVPKDKQTVLGAEPVKEKTINKEFAEGIAKDRKEQSEKPIKTLNVDA